MSIVNLSSDNLIDILSNLDNAALSQLCSSSKEFSTLCQSERIWETLTHRKYGSHIKKSDSWQTTYSNLNRPVYVVLFAGDPEYYDGPYSGVFYTFESAANFLLGIRDFDISELLDLKTCGYSELFFGIY